MIAGSDSGIVRVAEASEKEPFTTSARLVEVSSARITAAGLDVGDVSPFSGRWMSFLDPSRAKAELGFRHEPLRAYLEKIVASFLAHPPTEPPQSHRTGRAAEIEIASSGC
jgi:hypothetical protein